MELDESRKKLLKGGYLLLVGTFFLSSSSALIRAALQSTSIPTALCLQFTIAFLCGAPWILLTARKHIDRKNMAWHLARAVVAICTFFGFYFAIAYVPLVNAVLLNNTSPLFIPLILWVLHKKRISSFTTSVILLGFLGVFLILRPKVESFGGASFVGLISGVGSAASMLLAHRIALVDTSRKALFYYLFLVALLSAPFALLFWQKPSSEGLMALIGAGFLQMLAQAFFIHSFSFAPPSHIGPLSYMTVVFSGIIGMVFWGQKPDILALLGIAIVILSGSVVMYRRRGDS